MPVKRPDDTDVLVVAVQCVLDADETGDFRDALWELMDEHAIRSPEAQRAIWESIDVTNGVVREQGATP